MKKLQTTVGLTFLFVLAIVCVSITAVLGQETKTGKAESLSAKTVVTPQADGWRTTRCVCLFWINVNAVHTKPAKRWIRI